MRTDRAARGPALLAGNLNAMAPGLLRQVLEGVVLPMATKDQMPTNRAKPKTGGIVLAKPSFKSAGSMVNLRP